MPVATEARDGWLELHDKRLVLAKYLKVRITWRENAPTVHRLELELSLAGARDPCLANAWRCKERCIVITGVGLPHHGSCVGCRRSRHRQATGRPRSRHPVVSKVSNERQHREHRMRQFLIGGLLAIGRLKQDDAAPSTHNQRQANASGLMLLARPAYIGTFGTCWEAGPVW